ncbi:winged helix-turn-helix domain-containing protein [Kluyvera sp. CHPC 1.251]|uniref:winged helix-turn-helix domain-containing protein n=1 Tax=Kluyvera sp. CHPC 1.251 TaxID=2995175 RepID=UPI002FD7E9E1
MMSEQEDVSYLIENKIIFIPARQCLMMVDNPQQLKLKPTASQCLLLLIQNHGQIVAQNELLEFAWGGQHRQVSFNAFYQSILSLRKNFLHLKIEKAIITTVPRKGLVIQNDISIEKIATPVQENEPSSLPQLPEPAFEQDEHSPAPIKKVWITPAEISLIALALVVVSALLSPLWFQDDYFAHYVQGKITPGTCHYYFNNDASSFSRHNYFVDKNPQICTDGKYLYITAYPETKNISVIICTKPLPASGRNSCQSVYYPRYNS